MTNQFVNSVNSNALLDYAVNGTVEELTAFLQVYCTEIGYEQITSLDYELMSNAIFYYIHEAGITLNNINSSGYLNASHMLLNTENLTSFADDMSGYLLKVIDLAGKAGNEFAAGISDVAEAIEKGNEIFDTISNASSGNRKEIIEGLVSNAAGKAAGAFIPAIMSSGIPVPAKIILGFGLLIMGEAVGKGIEAGYIEIPISNIPHFPEDLDKRFKDILEKNGLDKDGVIIDAMNAYNNFMKKKDKNKGPSSDKAEKMISPIIIDLDNDGIETVSVNDGVYFDHDNNSYIERTAWVGKDDALLVRDVNGNGTIDSGRELFGNNTQLSDGTFAKNGYEALEQLDENSDGIIDSKDSIWNELYLWKDNNKNGYTDQGELITLSEASIAAIKYTYQDSKYIDQNGNKHKQISEVIMDNGEHTVSADVWFDTNNQNTYHIPTVDIRDDILRLPEISGMGNVTSLHESMNNDEELTKLVKDFIADPKSHTKDNLIEQIVYKWVGIEGTNETMQLVSFINNTTGTTFSQHASPIPGPAASTELKHELEKFEKYTAAQLLRQTEFALEFSTLELSYDDETHQLSLDTTLFESLIKSIEKSDLPRSLLIRKIFSDVLVYNPELVDMSNTIGIPELKIADKNHTNLVFHSNEAGNATSYYLKPGFNSVTLEDIESKTINTSTIYLNDFSSTDAVYTKSSNNLVITLSNNEKITILEYFTTQNNRRYNIHFNDKVVFQNDIESMNLNIYGTDAADYLSGWNNHEFLYGYGGNDSLYGKDGNDLLDGGDGDDSLYGEKGNDTLNGSAGNDSLSGGDGTDTYIFSAGHGHDTVTDKASSTINRLVFEGAQSARLLMKKDGYNLVIQAYGTDDAVTVKDFFYNTDNSRFELVFDDRTMSMEELHAAGFPVYGTEANDSLSGWDNADTLYGYGGNDSLYGKDGNDLLDGGDGDDSLYGEKGNDTLNGGAGNDSLSGGDGTDTYIFSAGHGHDTVTDKASSTINRLVFEGAQSARLLMKKDGYNLVIQAYGTDDAVTVKDFFYNADNSRFELVFDDRTMSMEELHAAGFPVYGTEANDSLSGWDNADTLYGYGGNDSLYGKDGNDLLDGGDGDDSLDGERGNDTLNGGAGNDSLSGGDGTDTYIFSAGHGHDTVTDKASSAINRLVFEGAQSARLLMKKDGYNLVIQAYGTDDAVTVKDFFYNTDNSRFELVFDDRTMSMEELHAAGFPVYGTEANDSLSGWDNADTLYGYGGNDSLYGKDGNDLLDGGDGDDSLYGEKGNDTLNGGAGNDSLSGGDGTDTYIFSAGHGHDTVTDKASSTINRLVFEGAQSARLLMKKDGYNLVIQAYGTDDAVTVKDFFYNADNSRFELVFDDRTMSMEELHAAGFPVYGTEANDSLSGWDNADTLYGYGGNDSLYGKDGNDLLDGGDGDDSLDGERGNDTLNGGAGNDSLSGGDGTDTYIFSAGHGHDTVTDKASSTINRLVFEGAQSARLLMKKDGYNLVIQAYGTDDAVTVKDFFYNADNSRFELVFDDRTMSMEELHAAGFPVYGTEANDSLSGWDNADTLYGYGGNDSLYGKDGNDLLDGGDGDDSLDGERGNDTLNGGAGNDSLSGGDGTDTYIFSAGHGHDTVTDKASSAINRLVFEGAQSARLLMKKDGYNLVIQAYGTDDAVTVKDFFYNTDNSRFELVFDDRTMSMEELHAAGFPVYGTEANDSLSGWDNADTLYGYGGNDSLYGKDGNDLLDGGAGNDSLSGGDGTDTYIFSAGHGHDTVTDKASSTINRLVFEGAQSARLLMKKDGYNLVIQAYGTDDAVTVKDFFYNADNSRFELVFDDRTMSMEELHAAGFPVYGTEANDSLSGWDNADTLYGYGGNDSLYGKDGNDLLDGGAGDDSLYGEKGNDTLNGSAGNDSLSGGDGTDTYIFSAGHGHDTVTDKASSTINRLVFEGAQSARLLMKKDGYNLVIQAYGTDDAVTVKDFFYNADNSRFELVFDDRTMSMEELHAAGFPVYGTEANDSLSGWDNADTLYGYGGNDSLYGKDGNDLLDGGDGDDSLYGEKGNDTLNGGAGNDSLSGGDGTDTYIFSAGHGHDTVTDKASSTINRLVFEGAQSARLLMKKDGYNLVIQAYGTDDAVTVKDFFYNADNSRFELVFDDRTMSMEELHAAGFPVYGTEANDSLSGWDNADTLYGYGGNDSLYGKDGNDLLDGGDGDDILDGEKGNDTLNGGAGNDSLSGGDGTDTYIFSAGHGHDTVTDKASSAINRLVFEGAQSARLLMKKDGYNLVIQAYGTDDAVTVKDFFYNADNSRFELVFDDRTMSMEELHAAGFPVYGTEANDSLSGWDNADTLYGYGGNDSLYGKDGNDLLDGGAGNDRLIGGDGSDVYKFYEGHGQDTMNDGASVSINKLVFEGAYVNYVSMERKGDDLVINAYRNEDSITIEDYFYSSSKRRLELHFEDKTVTIEELPEFVAETLAKNDLMQAQQFEEVSDGALTSRQQVSTEQLMTTSSDAAQLHQLIEAIAAFGDTGGGSGLTDNSYQTDNRYNHLTIPQ